MTTKQLNIQKEDFISAGSSGNIYKIHDNNKLCVIKLAKNNNTSAILRNEAAIYKIIRGKCNYIPKFYEEGYYYNNLTNEETFGIIIEYIPYKTLLDNSMYITSKNINKIFKKILKILNYFHDHNLVIRDIKPDNFLYDPLTNKIWMIDLGLINFSPFKYSEVKNFTGTLRYISPRCHTHVNTYYDDIQSAIYSIIYCYYGYLPWKIIKLQNESTKEYENKVKNIKEDTKFINMIQVFPEIYTIYNYVNNATDLLTKPDYEMIFDLIN